MEKRLFKFGGSSLAFVIPKKWADRNGLAASSMINIAENEGGDMIITTKEMPKSEAEEALVTHDMTFIGRLIGFHYMYGTTKLRLYSKEGLTQKETKEIENRVRRFYVGFEITSRSKNDVVLEDITNMREVSIKKIISRLRLLVSEEFKDILAKRYEAVPETEELINRFYLFGIRYLNAVKPKNMYIYLRPIEYLELVGDTLQRLSKADLSKIESLLRENQKQLELSISALGGNRESMNEAFKMAEAILKKMKTMKLEPFRYNLMYDLTLSINAIAEVGFAQERAHSAELLLEEKT